MIRNFSRHLLGYLSKLRIARVEKRNLKRHIYKVAFVSPKTVKEERKWVPVEEVTSLTLTQEKVKQNAARLPNKQKRNHFKRYRIVMQPEDYLYLIETKALEYLLIQKGVGTVNSQTNS